MSFYIQIDFPANFVSFFAHLNIYSWLKIFHGNPTMSSFTLKYSIWDSRYISSPLLVYIYTFLHSRFIFKSNKLPEPSEKQTYPASIYYKNSRLFYIFSIYVASMFNFYQTTDWELAVLSVSDLKQTAC